MVRGIGLRSGVSRVGGSITLWPKTSVVRLWARYGTKKRTRRRQAGVFTRKARCSTVSPTLPRPSSRTSRHVSPPAPVSVGLQPFSLSAYARVGSSVHGLSNSAESSCASSSSEMAFSASCTSLPVPHVLPGLRATSLYTSGESSTSSTRRAMPRPASSPHPCKSPESAFCWDCLGSLENTNDCRAALCAAVPHERMLDPFPAMRAALRHVRMFDPFPATLASPSAIRWPAFFGDLLAEPPKTTRLPADGFGGRTSATTFQNAAPRSDSARTCRPRQMRCIFSTAHNNVASLSPLMSADVEPSAGAESCVGLSAGMDPPAALDASIPPGWGSGRARRSCMLQRARPNQKVWHAWTQTQRT